jgi:hypothetical protein
MKTINKILALMAVLILVAAAAGLTFMNTYVFSTGQTWYSSTDISASGVQDIDFFNQGGADFTMSTNADSSQINSSMSGDFSGLTIFSELSVANDTGGEKTLSISNESMSLEESTSITPGGLQSSGEVYLSSDGEQNLRSEFIWWTDAGMNKDSVAIIPSYLYNTESVYATSGTGHYATTYLSPHDIYTSSNTSIFK